MHFLLYKHIKLSRVSAPVVGFAPFTSSRSQTNFNVFTGICASVKSPPSKLCTSNRLCPKYDPRASMLRKSALSMEVSSKEAPRASAPSKLALTYEFCDGKKITCHAEVKKCINNFAPINHSMNKEIIDEKLTKYAL